MQDSVPNQAYSEPSIFEVSKLLKVVHPFLYLDGIYSVDCNLENTSK